MAPLMLVVFLAWHPEGWLMALGFSVVFVALSLWLLPRLKGAFVGLQWAKRMHGFGGESRPCRLSRTPARRSATPRPSSWCGAIRRGRRGS